MADKTDTSGIQNWLAEHPDDPRAGAVRAKLRSMGVQVQDPPGIIEDYGQAAIQGGVLDPLEKVGQMAEHLPDWLGGGLARRAGSALSSIPFVSETMRQGQESAQRHPWVRTAGNILPWLAVPGFGEGRLAGLAADAAIGTLGGVTQPLDPKDPNYWRDVGLQGLLGGALGGGLGQVTRGAAAARTAQQGRQAAFDAATQARNAAEQRAERIGRFNQAVTKSNKSKQTAYRTAQRAQAQQTYLQRAAAQAAKQAQEAIPAQTTLNWWRETLTPIGEQARAPTRVTPETSAQVRKIVGDRLNKVRQQMLVNPDDATLGEDLAATQVETEGRLSNQAMRDQWAYQAHQEMAPDGSLKPPSKSELAKERNSIWSKYVQQPLAGKQYISGTDLADYVSRLGDLAEQYGRRALSAPQAERPELDAISRGLRRVIDEVERHGVGSDAGLAKQLTDAKRAYNLWSIGNGSTAAEKGGLMTPGGIAREWARRQGDAAYGAEMIPGHPQFHPENARIKQGLERARQAHEAATPPITPQPPLPLPGQRQTLPLPKVPPRPVMQQSPAPSKGRQAARHMGELAAHLPGAIAGLKIGTMLGHPYWGAGVGTAASRAMAPAVKSGIERAGRVPGALGATAGSSIPEIVVTAPRYRPGEDQETK